MILRRFKRKLLACGVIILGHVFLVWFIVYQNNSSTLLPTIANDQRYYPGSVGSHRERKGKLIGNPAVSPNSKMKILPNGNMESQDNVNKGKDVKILTTFNKALSKSSHTSTQSVMISKWLPKPKAKPSIDIVNDYYPFVDFKFVFPEISPKVETKQDIFMMVLVNSAAKGDEYRKRREAIRQTWGNRRNCEQRKALGDERLKDLRWLLVFVVGKAGPGTNDDELNTAEARQHNDMLIGNITDNYINNVIKFYMGQVWASRFDIKYTMKTDDDVYVRIPRVLEYLVNAKFPRPFYGGWTYAGTLVNRKIGGKWTVSWKYFGEKDWPQFNPGAFFILSSDLLNRLFNYVYMRKPFHTDDAYVGVAMRDFGVKITTIYSFRISANMPQSIRTMANCYLNSLNAFGHSLDPESLKVLDGRLQSLICGNATNKC